MTRLVLAALVALAVCGAPLSATVVVPTEFKEIVSDATLIIRGHVTDVRSVVVPNTGIESIGTIAVDVTIKGQADAFVSIHVPGGEIGRDRFVMVGAPRLTVGEAAVFFLKRDADNGWRPVGLTMGIFRMQSEPQTGRAVVDPPLMTGQTAAPGPVVRGETRRRSMPVAEFEVARAAGGHESGAGAGSPPMRRRAAALASLAAAIALAPSLAAYLKLGALAGTRVVARALGPDARQVLHHQPRRAQRHRDAAAGRGPARVRLVDSVPTTLVSAAFGGFTSAEPFTDDSISVIGFQPRPDLDRTLAATTFQLDSVTGRLIESDIFLNSAFDWSVATSGEPQRFDVQSIAHARDRTSARTRPFGAGRDGAARGRRPQHARARTP